MDLPRDRFICHNLRSERGSRPTGAPPIAPSDCANTDTDRDCDRVTVAGETMSELTFGTTPTTDSDLRKRIAALLAQPSAGGLPPEGVAAAWDIACAALEHGGGDPSAALLDGPLAAFVDASAPEEALAGVGAERVLRLGEATLALARRLPSGRRHPAHALLRALFDQGNRRALLREMSGQPAGVRWMDLVVAGIEETGYTTRTLFRRRVERYADETLFRVLDGEGGETAYTYGQVAAMVDGVAAMLHRLRAEEGVAGPVAILSRNRLEMALVDLACLTSGIVDVMVPTTSSPGHVRTILGHSESGLLFASGASFARRAFPPGDLAAHLRYYVLMDPTPEMRGPEIRFLPDLLAADSDSYADAAREAGEAVGIRDLASIMYTSGTTGQPKGIPFHHLNIVSKRFARALALPDLGHGDRFLCYLPLCHTFGRWFEMMGSIFWGGSYAFLSSPARHALLAGMQSVRPTIFISVPSKWVELHEQVSSQVDVEKDDPEVIRSAVAEVTGGSLRTGLSAAGRLEPDIFKFFQANGVELLSGYGMTEATGGVSMTRPGEYQEESVGVPLPGIEARLAEDGELLLRGPYVIESYYKPLPEDDAVRDGWLCTGDLFDGSPEEGFRFRDRKKDVYKNSKGQTIAPRLIEKHLEDFDEVQSCFLVGDGKPFNTALIYPNYSLSSVSPEDRSEQQRREYFRSIIVSVNRFLDPFERVVNFALIDRDFDKDRDERTEKGSLRRKVIEEHFADQIQELYKKEHVMVSVRGADVLVPIWLLRELGLPSESVRATRAGIELEGAGRFLPIRADAARRGRYQVGSLWYEVPGDEIDLDLFLRTPRLWVGNVDLVTFSGEGIFDWSLRPIAAADRIVPVGWAAPTVVVPDLAGRLHDVVERAELSHRSVHVAFSAILMQDRDLESYAVRFLGTVLRESHSDAFLLARDRLLLAAAHPERDTRRLAFMCLGTAREETGFQGIVESYWGRLHEVLDDEMVEVLCQVGVGASEVESLLSFLKRMRTGRDPRAGELDQVEPVFRFLARYGSQHDDLFRAIRRELTGWALTASADPFGTDAYRSIEEMSDRFRERLGCWGQEAVDPETGARYDWDEVVVFEEGLDPGDRERIRMAFERTTVLPEAFALLCEGDGPQSLADVAPGGIWVTFQDLRHGRTHFRVVARSRVGSRYEFGLTLYSSHLHDTIETEILWNIRMAGGRDANELVHDIGGLYRDYALWSSASSRGETVRDLLHRLLDAGDPQVRSLARGLWPFLAWSALAAYIEFWNRMARRWIVAGPSPAKVVVPPHDYLEATRITSMAGRRRVDSLVDLLQTLEREFLASIHFHYPELDGAEDEDLVLLAVLEVLGRDEGVDVLRSEAARPDTSEVWRERLERFVTRIEESGFSPKPLFFAVRRYHRWLALSPDATPAARATMLRELWDAYGLGALRDRYPELRVRFFRQTVFADVDEALARELDRLIVQQRAERLQTQDLLGRVSRLREKAVAGTEEEFLLARMAYPYLEDTAASLVTLQEGSLVHADLVVTMQDADGRSIRIRHAATPREVGRLRRLFVEAEVNIHFVPEHRYLVMLDEREFVIGGLVYLEGSGVLPSGDASRATEDGDKVIRIERYVVAPHRRKKGIGRLLVEEFCNRMAGRGKEIATIAFMHPRYHESLGFVIDHVHGGLMRKLAPALTGERGGERSGAFADEDRVAG